MTTTNEDEATGRRLSLGERLAARLEMPAEGAPRAGAILVHCYTCAKAQRAAREIALALTHRRIAVLHFEPAGGAKGGQEEAAGISLFPDVREVVAAAEALEAQGLAPALLVGHSLGGAVAILAAAKLPALRAVATIGAPFDAGALLAAAEPTEVPGEVAVGFGGEAVRLRRDFVESLARESLAEPLRALDAALLVMHSPRDQVIGIENAERIFQAAAHPRGLLPLDDANHLLTSAADAHYAGVMLATWAARYLPPAPAEEEPEPDPSHRVVTRTGARGYRTEIRAGPHELLADEPERLGGTDLGSTPYDLMMAALGACTGITLRMYADRKGWPLEEAEIRMRHGRVHGIDSEECPERGVRVDRIERELELRGPLDAEQRARLAEIADRCPVHRTLSAGVLIDTTLAREGSGAGEAAVASEAATDRR